MLNRKKRSKWDGKVRSMLTHILWEEGEKGKILLNEQHTKFIHIIPQLTVVLTVFE
jgi:hypothetical protein